MLLFFVAAKALLSDSQGVLHVHIVRIAWPDSPCGCDWRVARAEPMCRSVQALAQD